MSCPATPSKTHPPTTYGPGQQILMPQEGEKDDARDRG
jgi:hypothetical protein